jgi:hypothetical protein
MNSDFRDVFSRLRQMMLEATPAFVVTKDEAKAVEVRTKRIDPKTKQRGWFGTVTIKKTYVAYHLIPLYTHPELARSISPELTKRRQGKTCFNFTRCDDALFSELARLTATCAAQAEACGARV